MPSSPPPPSKHSVSETLHVSACAHFAGKKSPSFYQTLKKSGPLGLICDEAGVGCVISGTSWGSCCASLSTPSRCLGTRNYFKSLEGARPSLSITAPHGTCEGAMRMSACLVTGFSANKTLWQGRGIVRPVWPQLFSSVILTEAKCPGKFESQCCCV